MTRHFVSRAILGALSVFATAAGVANHARASWPPAANANMSDPANWPNDYSGDWAYSSSLPNRSLLSADTSLGAAGMSIDRSWSLTTGADDTLIAVLDSGIEWEDANLLENVWLNRAELDGIARPRSADGAPCADYDCNGDGRFTVKDYANDPRLSPLLLDEQCYVDPARTQMGGPRMRGDLNRNCVLDAGDLILLYSDGVDDDGNGYTDDIAGWDFAKNDNDPYDDLRSGHGSASARALAATANDGGAIGVCPTCRFVPIRVGDTFVANANDFAKGLLYAADLGANVASASLFAVNHTTFSKSAIDYAYGKGTVLVASLGEENSRQARMPAMANHVLAVHTIRFDGQTPDTSSTFLSFDTCSNFGANLSLSVSSTSCGSEGAARMAGILGLIHSYAGDLGVRLTAEESMQIVKGTADDINVAESRDQSHVGAFYSSKAGWDQRFGYGRVNADHALAQLRSGLIPPEVDILSPEWSLPIFADRLGEQIAIRGRVAAVRATSYDLHVEWAPGVEPDDAEFQQVVPPLRNVPSSTISGSDSPLAAFDPRAIDPSHARDADSLNGENDHTITLRVRAIAHYPNGDAKGEARRAVSIVNEKTGLDADLLPGFPIRVDGSAEASPKIADIDGDGIGEIVYPTSDGLLHVFTMRTGAPTELAGFPFRTDLVDGLNPSIDDPNLPNYLAARAYRGAGGVSPLLARETLISAPAVADIDGDGSLDIVFSSFGGTVYAIDAKGALKAGWPKRLGAVPSCSLDSTKMSIGECSDASHTIARGTFASPVVTDLDSDGRIEIIQAAFDGQVHAWYANGDVAKGFPIAVHHSAPTENAKIVATPTVADLNGDKILDVIVASTERIVRDGTEYGAVHAFSGKVSNASTHLPLSGWPIAVPTNTSLPTLSAGAASPVAADFDRDGRADIVAQSNGTLPWIVSHAPGLHDPFAPPPNLLPEASGNGSRGLTESNAFGTQSQAAPDSFGAFISQPSIGDLDQDGVPDLVVGGGSSTLRSMGMSSASAKTPQKLLAMWSGRTGAMLPGSPFPIEDHSWFVNYAIADVTGDDYPEAIGGNGSNLLHAVDACGREATGFPKFTGGSVVASAAVGNIDGRDGRSLDVVVGTRAGYIFAWRTKGTLRGVTPWPTIHHDNANTGNYHTPLPNGSTLRASFPLTCGGEGGSEAVTYDLGGCSAGTTRTTWSAGQVALFGAFLVRCRRRRRTNSGK